MAQKQLRPAPLAKVAGLGNLLSSTDRKAENTFELPALQVAFLARFGLDTTRARLTAELAGRRT